MDILGRLPEMASFTLFIRNELTMTGLPQLVGNKYLYTLFNISDLQNEQFMILNMIHLWVSINFVNGYAFISNRQKGSKSSGLIGHWSVALSFDSSTPFRFPLLKAR